MVATKPISMASFYFGKFKPHLVANTQLYIQRKDSTVSLCPDYSANGYDFTQGVATNQPTLSANSIDFTTNDFMINNTANVFSGDSSGYIFFAMNHITGQRLDILTSCDTATNNFDFRLVSSASTNKIQLIVRQSGVNNTVILDTTTLINGFNYGWIRSNGSAFSGKVNGVSQTINATIDNGAWLNSVTNRDNIAIGATIRLSPLYGEGGINKVHYVSGSLSAIDIWKIEQFMSNPLNYI